MYAKPQPLLILPHRISDRELIQRWVQRKPPQKQHSYWQAANQFRTFLAKPLAQVTEADIQAFAVYLSDRQLPPQSCGEILLAVKSFLNFASKRPHRQRSQGKALLTKLFASRLPFQWQLGLCACLFFGLGVAMPRWLGVTWQKPDSESENSRKWEDILPESPLDAASGVNSAKIRAFLDTIAIAEGTAGPEGYTTQFTGLQFSSFEDHPRQVNCGWDGARRICSDAAGRYQLLSSTWDRLAKKLGVQDFRPTNQDRVAVELMRERGALEDVEGDRFEATLRKLAPVWPSLKRLGGGSLEASIPQLKQIYQQNFSRYRSRITLR